MKRFDPTITYKVSSGHVILTEEAWDALVEHHNELVGLVNQSESDLNELKQQTVNIATQASESTAELSKLSKQLSDLTLALDKALEAVSAQQTMIQYLANIVKEIYENEN